MANPMMMRVERRLALRVPVRGAAVLYTGGTAVQGTLENLSQSGALITFPTRPLESQLDLEIRIAEGGGWVIAHSVRVEPAEGPVRVAVAFERVDQSLRTAIDLAIASVQGAKRSRPIMVIDENSDRKRALITRLSSEGMTPLAPRTPLEAVEMLNSSPLHVGVCLVAPGFGVQSTDLRDALNDSFPALSLADITDDLDETTHQAIDTWNTTPIARIDVA
jgi:hypothetical protein